MKFCVGSSFFAEFWQRDRYPRSTERLSCFPNAVWASASVAFHIISDTLIIIIIIIIIIITKSVVWYPVWHKATPVAVTVQICI